MKTRHLPWDVKNKMFLKDSYGVTIKPRVAENDVTVTSAYSIWPPSGPTRSDSLIGCYNLITFLIVKTDETPNLFYLRYVTFKSNHTISYNTI
jgi:hypothetical protein